MKNRGAVRIFTLLLSVICLYYLSFSLVTWRVESKAKDWAASQAATDKDGEQRLTKRYLDSMAGQEVYPVLGFTYEEAKEKKLNLGLDLQGGMHVTLELAVDKLIKELSGVRAGDPNEELMKISLEAAKEKQRTSQEDFVDLFYQAFTEQANGKTLYEVFDTRDNQGQFDKDASNKEQEVLSYIKRETSDAVERTTDILRTRIDKFGVTQPTIREEGAGRITIELPGADDVERIRKILKSSAKLEFWETYTSVDMVNTYFPKVNEILKDKLGLVDSLANDSASAPASGGDPLLTTESEGNALTTGDELTSSENNDPLLSDGNALDSNSENLSGDSTKNDSNSLLANTNDTNGLNQDTAQQSADEFFATNPLYKYLQPPVNQQNQIQPGPIAGYVNKNDTAKVMEYLSFDEVKNILPDDIKFMWNAKGNKSENGEFFTLIALKGDLDGSASLDGKVVVDAGLQFDPNGSPGVRMRMNVEGANAWKNLTGRNIDKSVAIALDNAIYSYPTVQGEIPNGISTIEGNFTIDEAKDLANILKAGKLPITLDIVEEAVVGPTLGQKSINDGITSLMIGFLLVLVFMAIYYNRGGWVANLALLANLFFIIGTLASVQAALTLPGMAGIVLTIGMSVDANVLIFERIREELKAGKGVKQAISDGYKNALTSIVDANVTTLLTAIILYVFGKGPISGFGVILLIGIVTSFFCAVFLSRLIFLWLLDRDRSVKFGSAATMNMFGNFSWDFIGKRKVAYLISGLIIVGGMASLFTKGLNLSVDFEGGRAYIISMNEAKTVTEVRDNLTEVFGSQPEVKTFGSPSTLKITTKYMIDSEEEKADSIVQATLQGGLQTVLGDEGTGYTIESGQKVGPTFARDIKIAAIWSIVVGLVFIFLYIVIRFRKWQYGLGALVALFHDVLIVLSLFSIFWNVLPFNLEVDQAFIAAILTVVGYSINDTVVVFDRIRENISLHTRMPLHNVINDALNKTVSRTFITSITTLLVIIVLFATGGEIIRGFSFALLIGVIVGTYSSLFIATPIVVDLDKNDDPKRQVEENQNETESVTA